MVARNALVLIGGKPQEMPGGDTLNGAGTPADPCNPTTAKVWSDDFMFGSNETGEIGELNWTFSQGSMQVQTSEQNHPGCFLRTSGATANQIASMIPSNVNSLQFRFDEFDETTWVVRATATNTDCAYRFGMGQDPTLTTLGTHGIFFERLSTDAGWFLVTRNNSAQTRTDTSVPFNTSWIKLKFRRVSATEVAYSINGAAEVTVTANIPDAADGMLVFNQLVPTTTTARAVVIDFHSGKLLPVTR